MRSLVRLLVMIVLSGASSLHAQSVEGNVLDRGTGRAVPEVAVTALTESGRVVGRALADSAGKFVVHLAGGGSYHLRADRIGYRQVMSPAFEVAHREALQVDLYLSAGAVELDPLTITSRAEPPHLPYLERSGFYQRERTNPGVFMRREDVERNRGGRMSDLLAKIPGVRRATVQGRPAVSLGRAAGGRVCTPGVFVDGQPVVRSEGIDDIVHVAAIEAVEVYRGPSQTPARFSNAESGCGVIVIWTQRNV